jgi:hypothetical protein
MEFARVAAGEDGVATTTFAGLPSGINLVSVAFQGTTALLGSVSSAITVNVNSARAASATVAMLDVQAQVSASDYLPLSATASGTGPAPGGVVNFYLGTTLMGSASVVQGVAMTLSSVLPPPGAGLLTAHYSGDANYDAAVSTPISIDVVASAVSPPPPAAVPDFTLTAPSTITMAQGDNSNILLTITPLNGFASAIQFACTGAVSGYSCTAPASVTPRASLTVSAILAAQAAAFLPFSAVLLLRKRRRVLFTGGLLLALSGCGYHVNQPGQAVTAAKDSGNYSVTITATSGTLIHTAVVTVIVQ